MRTSTYSLVHHGVKSLSPVIAGGIVHRVGSNARFLFLAAVASAAFAILYFLMPETRNLRLAKE